MKSFNLFVGWNVECEIRIYKNREYNHITFIYCYQKNGEKEDSWLRLYSEYIDKDNVPTMVEVYKKYKDLLREKIIELYDNKII